MISNSILAVTLLWLDIVGNTVCADLLDYAQRDSHFAGLRLDYDSDRIAETFTLVTFDATTYELSHPQPEGVLRSGGLYLKADGTLTKLGAMILMACCWLSAPINSSSKPHRMNDFLPNGIHGWFNNFTLRSVRAAQFKSASHRD